MIRLGDVNFDLGADTRGLRRSEQALRQFGTTVDRVASGVGTASTQIERDLRRQEKAATDALNKVLGMNQQMRKVKDTGGFVNQNIRSFRQLNDVLTSGRLSALQYQRAMEQFKASTQNTSRSFRDFYVQAKAGHGANQGFIESLQNLSNGLVFIQGPLGGFATRLTSIVALMKRGGLEVAAFLGGIAAGSVTFYKLGTSILEAGKQAKSFLSQLKAVTGSQGLAEESMRRVMDIARLSGQRIEDLGQGYAKFLAAAKGTGLSLATVDEIFTNVSKAATTMNMSAEQSQGIFKALEQMLSKGTVQAEELRGQLGDRLPGAFQLAARAMGLTTRELGELMKKGEIMATDLLPKLAKELAKSLNFDDKPINNYTAAVNNASTAWFQLRVELDNQLGVTNKVMQMYIQLTQAIDWVRKNLDTLKLALVAATGAFLGLVGPAILASVIRLTQAMNGLTASVRLFNIAILSIVRIPLMIAGAIIALYQFRDEIRLVKGELASLGDYITVLGQDIQNSRFADYFRQQNQEIQQDLAGLGKFFLNIFQGISGNARLTWDDVGNGAIDVGNGILDAFYNVARAMPTIFKQIGHTVAFYMVEMWNGILSIFESGINNLFGMIRSRSESIVATFPLLKNLMPMPEDIRIERVDNQWVDSWKKGNEEVKRIVNEEHKFINRAISQVEEWRKRANAAALTRIYNDPSRKNDIYKPPEKLTGFEPFKPPNDNGGGAKAAKAAERLKAAWDNIDEAISRVREELAAMGEDEATLNSLREGFKREKEVKKYADALKKAGANTEDVKNKTQELMDLLVKRDTWKKALEAIGALQDTLAQGMDTAWSSIIDGIFEGKNALESLADVAKSVVKDIIQTWTKLAILNPIKNYLFGTDEATLSGGFLGNMMKAMPGLSGNKGQEGSFPKQIWNDLTGNLKAANLAVSNFGLQAQNVAGVTVDAFGSIGRTVPVAAQQLDMLGGGFNKFGVALETSAQSMQGGFMSWLSNAFSSIFGGGASYFPPMPVGLYAKGGAFGPSGEIFNTPTNFSYGGGNIGQLGEAGAEAVMPLTKDSTGQLGVQAVVPRSNDTSPGNVIVNIFTSDGQTATTEQSKDSDGNDVIDVFITQAKQAIANDVAKGGSAINKAMEGRYNLKASSGLK